MFGMLFFSNPLLGNIFKYIFYTTGLLLVFGLVIRNEYKSLLKFNIHSYESLFEWSNDLQGGHLLLKNLLENEKVDIDILLNMKNIKNKIMVYCQHDINNLRLLNAFFKILKEEKEKETYYRIVIGFIISISVLYFRGNQGIEFLTLYSPLELFIALMILLVFLINITYLGNKRIRIIQEIIEECIKEKN
jgi:hypothetical protein